MLKRVLSRLSCLMFITLVAGVGLCQAQSIPPKASLRGKVVDRNRAAIVGARIRVAREGGPSKSSAITDGAGQFSFLLEPGAYLLTIVAEGFAETTTAVNLGRSGLNTGELLLQVAGSSATVTVTNQGGYQTDSLSSATKTAARLRDIPQTITVVTKEQIREQAMESIADVVNYVPGVTSHQGENNRDQVVIRGNSTSADFFLNGVRDDAQYYRDFYNVERVELLKGPNAMIFGRGGGGGVVNRVTKEAGFDSWREITLQGGSFGHKRFTIDLNHPLNESVAFRLNGFYENADSFRDYVEQEQYGINPTLTIAAGPDTRLTFGYERFHDHRTADRGIPSYLGRPADLPISTFFGNPNDSPVSAAINLASATLEHRSDALTIRNRTLFGDYDRSYQNYVSGAVTGDKTRVALSAYNNATRRRNIFNQTDLIRVLTTGRVRHTFLAGTEFGRQLTDNLRHTGFFNNSTTSILVPYENPVTTAPIVFRQSATDADNHLRTNLVAGYVQDQIEISRQVQVIAGVRFDYFDLQFHNQRTGENLRRIDRLVSPRAGIVFKPIELLSVYANYSVAHLPSSGDQFSSLTAITQQVKPEKFKNYELGAKWDVLRGLAVTMATYRLDRTNTRATDPNDPTRILQTGSQRTQGFELGWNGNVTRAWRIAGGYAYQDAFITSATIAARAGAQVPLVPRHTFSLWNNYQVNTRLGVGLGVIRRSQMYAAIDNTVTLPGYSRADLAVHYSVTEKWRLQANIENLFGVRYFLYADGNNNISPGRPRGARVGLIARF